MIVPAIVRIHFLASATGTANPMLTRVNELVGLQIEMHYGLIASTIPTLKPFVSAFNSGFGTGDTQGITEYPLQSLDKQNSHRRSRGRPGKDTNTQQEDEVELHPGHIRLQPRLGGKNTTRISGPEASALSPRSRSSHSSQRMYIRQTGSPAAITEFQ